MHRRKRSNVATIAPERQRGRDRRAGMGPRAQVSKVKLMRLMIFTITITAALATHAFAEDVTFTKDVAPILQKACQNCHRPGAIAPMSLLTYQDARPWARSIRQKVTSREMPPWYIDRHIGITKFKDDPSLTDEEIATIVAWVDAGAPQGRPGDMPKPRVFADDDKWHIGKPDLV